MVVRLETERLVLRQWRLSDYAPFAAMTANPKVMRFFPSVLSREESDQVANKIESLIAQKGWGFWAVELKKTSEFIGFVGLHYQDQAIPDAPFVEIGWRLSEKHWGLGYAPEAANEAMRFAFDILNESAVYAFTTLQNVPSRKVMSKIGMMDTNMNFNHPALDAEHPLSRHCLYKITDDMWRKSMSGSLANE
ncbi:GNAT family N-acetyltransferase [uncultured Photobacterium sp.]|uniref:GNAT family N-acetyltransferase n=1 Tax=uncultured Photobacterium sp. TaxID=173973 RepID=UPI00263704DA|nr:GNAT family N-acetyltransferase [uncultured Photobacterium sp.]